MPVLIFCGVLAWPAYGVVRVLTYRGVPRPRSLEVSFEDTLTRDGAIAPGRSPTEEGGWIELVDELTPEGSIHLVLRGCKPKRSCVEEELWLRRSSDGTLSATARARTYREDSSAVGHVYDLGGTVRLSADIGNDRVRGTGAGDLVIEYRLSGWLAGSDRSVQRKLVLPAG